MPSEKEKFFGVAAAEPAAPPPVAEPTAIASYDEEERDHLRRKLARIAKEATK